jgi:xanthine dehydrogenase accessory factor
VEVFVEVIQPPLALTIFGTGDDAIPLANFASLLGWQTTILDYRPAFATPDRFPLADRLLPGRPDAALATLALDERSAVVLMSHNYEQDKAFLYRLLSANVSYIGILGPVKRTDRLLNDLRADGISLADDFLARLHSPAGLDIGSETPEEIALSIIAEIQAAHTLTTGVSLRDRATSLQLFGMHISEPSC